MQVILPQSVASDTALAQTFLKETPVKRLALLKEICEEKDKVGATAFLNTLETLLRKKVSLEKASAQELKSFEEIATVRSYITNRGASVKMLLEHLSMIIPRIA
jgi:hypothetical protein